MNRQTAVLNVRQMGGRSTMLARLPTFATGGSGDVPSGIIRGLLAPGKLRRMRNPRASVVSKPSNESMARHFARRRTAVPRPGNHRLEMGKDRIARTKGRHENFR